MTAIAEGCCDRPHYAKGMCRSCYEKDLRQRNPEYADRQRANARDWVERPGNKERKSDVGKDYRKRRPQDHRAKTARTYGLTKEEYAEIMARPCGICGAPSKHLDHDHRHCPARKGCRECIRGALCHRCNLGVGYYEGWFAENADAALEWMSRTMDTEEES